MKSNKEHLEEWNDWAKIYDLNSTYTFFQKILSQEEGISKNFGIFIKN